MEDDKFTDLYPDEENQSEFSMGFEPQRMSSEQFKQRNDPQELLQRIRLMLMNAYATEINFKDKDGKIKKKFIVKQKKNTKPKANKEGVEGILRYIEFFINGHTVQGNMLTDVEFEKTMRYISIDVTIHFMTKRLDWGISIRDIDELIATSVHLIHLFLTRTLNNEERRGYGETFKENRNVEEKTQSKASFMDKVGGFLKNKGWV